LPGGKILPKAIEITLDFTALHEKTLGWQNNSFAENASLYGTTSISDGYASNNPSSDPNPLGGDETTEQTVADLDADTSNLIDSNGNRLGNYGYADATREEQAATDEIGKMFDDAIS